MKYAVLLCAFAAAMAPSALLAEQAGAPVRPVAFVFYIPADAAPAPSVLDQALEIPADQSLREYATGSGGVHGEPCAAGACRHCAAVCLPTACGSCGRACTSVHKPSSVSLRANRRAAACGLRIR
jgi:hypothetical protein